MTLFDVLNSMSHVWSNVKPVTLVQTVEGNSLRFRRPLLGFLDQRCKYGSNHQIGECFEMF
jgi:hypothetical protein